MRSSGYLNSNNGSSSSLESTNVNKSTDKNQLYLKVVCNCATDLVPQDTTGTGSESKKAYSSSKSINPVLVVQLNNTIKSTSKKLNTNQPSWNDELYMPLKNQNDSSLLIFSVWDKHTRYKNYLGELRLNVKDIFVDNGNFVDKTELKWYHLNSNTKYHSFVTGSILAGFELVIKNKKKRFHSSYNDKFLQLSIDSDVESAFKKWLSSLTKPTIYSVNNKIDPNDQGFYDDELVNEFDLESVLTERSKKSHLNVPGGNGLLSVPGDDCHDAGSFSDASFLSDGGYASDASANLFDQKETSSDLKKSRIKSKMRLRRSKQEYENFELASRQVLGVVFIEIVSCEDLPPYKNFTRTSFDMDPFVVVSFGKKTFRTGWKRHTLNPVFNERLAFELLPHESNFSIQFLVLDKDHFSFHDNVAHISLPLRTLTEYATAKPTEGDSSDVNTSDSTSFSQTGNGFTTEDTEFPENDSVQIIENETPSNKQSRKRYLSRKKVVGTQLDLKKFKAMSLSLQLHDQKYIGKYAPKLKIRVRFETYTELRKKFWRVLLEESNSTPENRDSCDYIELISLLDTLGCVNSDELVELFYSNLGKLSWGGDLLTFDEIIDQMETYVNQNVESGKVKIFEFEKCPICNEKRVSKKQDLDIITHFAICASKDWSVVSKLLLSSYVTPTQATKKWFTKALIKLTYGKYKLGGNSANILVQDRMTGIIVEEKMSVYVRLGIRLLYKGLDKARSKRVRILLKNMSIKQGKKFDAPQLKSDIASFIKFHKLDLDECEIDDPSQFATFNDFFYRKLKPGTREIEDEKNSKIVTSPADCRSVVFESIDKATQLWIKGAGFTIPKLIHNDHLMRVSSYTLGIFRLAPQDYHRFHSPVDGVIESIKHIDGEYYTVNPMAIRSELDVFGENVRTIVTIRTKDFGNIYFIAVGAMMVGSIVLTKDTGYEILKGEELGYFKFGGSTVLLLIESDKFKFDTDLVKNSFSGLETLLRVGQSIGHSPDVEEYKRDHISFDKLDKSKQLRLIRVLTGGDLKDKHKLSNWEATKIDMEDFQEIEDEEILDKDMPDEDASIKSED